MADRSYARRLIRWQTMSHNIEDSVPQIPGADAPMAELREKLAELSCRAVPASPSPSKLQAAYEVSAGSSGERRRSASTTSATIKACGSRMINALSRGSACQSFAK